MAVVQAGIRRSKLELPPTELRRVHAQTERAVAVNNRRLNRAARTASQHAKREQREAREREAAVRMTRRFFGGQMPALMCLDYRYWQARRCGWDALSKEYARNPLGVACDPHDGAMWYFWTRQHYKVRAQLVTLSTFRLYR